MKKPSPNFSSKKNFNLNLFGGLNPSEKYDFVNWDDEIPNIWNNKIPWFQTTNQNRLSISP